jgi:hypothetical protein
VKKQNGQFFYGPETVDYRNGYPSGKSGKGGQVKSRKQAIAIGLSEARKKGAKVPKQS